MQTRSMIVRYAHCCAWLVLAATALMLGVAEAQVSGGNPTASRQETSASAVPDPGALKAGWWDYVAPSEPGLDQRLTLLVSRAGAAAAQVPESRAGQAAQAMERLRLSLSALPGMIAARPGAPPDAPPLADTYTASALLALDRRIRELQVELDERRSAITVAARALEEAQRELDRDFAAYIAAPGPGPDRVVAGLEIMATRAEIALTASEQKLRQAEADALSARVNEMAELRSRGLTRIVPDPTRSANQVSALVTRSEQKLEEQREALLRLRAARSSLASRPDTGKADMELADLRITAAMIEEALLGAKVDLYDTELDWLAISGGGLSTAAVAAIDGRLDARLQALSSTETDIADWSTVVQRVLGTALRTPKEQLPASEQRTRDALLDLAQASITSIDQLRTLVADIRFGAQVTSSLLAQRAGWLGWLRSTLINPAMNVMAITDDWLDTSLFRIGDAPVTAYGLLGIALTLMIAVVLSRIARFLLGRFGGQDPGRPSAGLYTLGRLLHYFLIAAALLIGLSSIGLDFSQVALVAGALSIGIGFGLQSIVNNFVSGLMILFEQNLKIGDAVQLDSGLRGVVKEINVRSTLISTNDAVDIVVPNSEFISGKVTNFTLREPYHRIHVPFGVAYGTDKELVRRVVIDAADKVKYTHHRKGRETDVWLVRFGESSLDFELVVWINPTAVTRPRAVMAAYLWEIETTLVKNGIEIPFPQRDVHVRTAAALAAPGSNAQPEPRIE